MLWAAEPANPHSSVPPSGRSFFAVLCPPGLCLSQGECQILGCVPWRPGPRSLCCWNCTLGASQPPLRGATA